MSSVGTSLILALDETGLMQALPKCGQPVALFVSGCDAEKSNHRHRRLLSVRSERPYARRGTNHFHEVASPHCFPQAWDHAISGFQLRPSKQETAASEIGAVSLV